MSEETDDMNSGWETVDEPTTPEVTRVPQTDAVHPIKDDDGVPMFNPQFTGAPVTHRNGWVAPKTESDMRKFYKDTRGIMDEMIANGDDADKRMMGAVVHAPAVASRMLLESTMPWEKKDKYYDIMDRLGVYRRRLNPKYTDKFKLAYTYERDPKGIGYKANRHTNVVHEPRDVTAPKESLSESEEDFEERNNPIDRVDKIFGDLGTSPITSLTKKDGVPLSHIEKEKLANDFITLKKECFGNKRMPRTMEYWKKSSARSRVLDMLAKAKTMDENLYRVVSDYAERSYTMAVLSQLSRDSPKKYADMEDIAGDGEIIDIARNILLSDDEGRPRTFEETLANPSRLTTTDFVKEVMGEFRNRMLDELNLKTPAANGTKGGRDQKGKEIVEEWMFDHPTEYNKDNGEGVKSFMKYILGGVKISPKEKKRIGQWEDLCEAFDKLLTTCVDLLNEQIKKGVSPNKALAEIAKYRDDKEDGRSISTKWADLRKEAGKIINRKGGAYDKIPEFKTLMNRTGLWVGSTTFAEQQPPATESEAAPVPEERKDAAPANDSDPLLLKLKGSTWASIDSEMEKRYGSSKTLIRRIINQPDLAQAIIQNSMMNPHYTGDIDKMLEEVFGTTDPMGIKKAVLRFKNKNT